MATAIAEALNLNDVQVRKDLASVSKGGKPKVGYVTEELIGDIGQFLGFENKTGVIIAGVGNLGRALPFSHARHRPLVTCHFQIPAE